MRVALLLCALWLTSCRSKAVPQSDVDDFHARDVTLPHGQVLKVETMILQEDLLRGMKFRKELPMGRGMLFVYSKPGSYPYGMFQVLIPLDILWLSGSRTIVEMVKNAQPCTGATPRECPVFVGRQPAQFVLELPAGSINRYQLESGQTIDW